MTVLLLAIVSIGLIILIGFIAGKTLTLERQTLSQLAINILSPALITDSLYRATQLLGLLLMYRITEVFRSGYLKAALFNQVTQRPEA